MKSIKAGINKVVCSFVEESLSETILLKETVPKYKIMTCDPALKFEHGEEAIIRPQSGYLYRVDKEDFWIVEAKDILMTITDE